MDVARIVRTALIVAAIGLVAAGCAHEDDRDLSHLPGFTAGYTDGCRTAHNRERGFATKALRDADRFSQDAAYRAGWRDGSMTCGASDGLGRNRMFEDQQVGPAPL